VGVTIAACYLSQEGVVLGADSTTTIFVERPSGVGDGENHHFDHAQKVFEIGECASLGMATWGLGSLPGVSLRTLFAKLGDVCKKNPPKTVKDAATTWSDMFWNEYSRALSDEIKRGRELEAKSGRTTDEQQELETLSDLFSGGFCIAGHCGALDRNPCAYEVLYSPTATGTPVPEELGIGGAYWGCPNLVSRVIFGIDQEVFNAILSSGKWTGSPQELFDVIKPSRLGQPSHLPIRDAIDWVYSSILTTIKAMRFSHLEPVCGGSIEVAVITSDRPFRWVSHKRMSDAIADRAFKGYENEHLPPRH
jgi:hypothetical protein